MPGRSITEGYWRDGVEHGPERFVSDSGTIKEYEYIEGKRVKEIDYYDNGDMLDC